MATIYIDNLVKPREVNSPNNYLSKETIPNQYVYTDLHLDLTIDNNVGNGLNPVQSKDITVDYDSNAIRNSLYNIFTTRKGQKILDPNFGGSLDQYLFESVSNVKAKILGDSIVQAVSQYEPRVSVENVQVMPIPDENQYHVIFVYAVLNIGRIETFKINFQANNIDIYE
jgi:phage baseplate assembly protein W